MKRVVFKDKGVTPVLLTARCKSTDTRRLWALSPPHARQISRESPLPNSWESEEMYKTKKSYYGKSFLTFQTWVTNVTCKICFIYININHIY